VTSEHLELILFPFLSLFSDYGEYCVPKYVGM